jgi:multidrug efflux pump subunit AcrA (membrane-fusion protein)
VAKEAIRGGASAPFVWVARDGRLERRVVRVGGTLGPDVQILAGLDAGDAVVVRGPEGLADGQRVTLRR